MSEPIFYKSIDELKIMYEEKSISPLEVTEDLLKRIKKHNNKLNAYLEIYNDDAINCARSLDNSKSHNPLFGIPLGLKDLVDIKNKITTAGSKILENNKATKNSKITQDFLDNQSIILGKTNLVEFAFGTLGINSNTNTCRNPWDTERVPGGSSSGSAVAVSAGLATFAIGTDTGGSIRMPASLCGITGFKPSYGIVSRRGVLDLSWSMDHVGPMARSAKDCLNIMKVIGGYDPRDKYSIKIEDNHFNEEAITNRNEIRLGLPKNYFFEEVNEEIKINVMKSVDQLSNMGYQIEEIDLPFVADGRKINIAVLLPEAISVHSEYIKNYKSYTKTVLNRMIGGLGVSSEEYLTASRAMSSFNYQMNKKMNNIDALITPTVPVIAPLISESSSPNTYESNSMGRFTGVFNLTGQPSISVPCGFTENNLPIGMMLTGKINNDNKLLNIAIDWQSETEFHTKRPILN